MKKHFRLTVVFACVLITTLFVSQFTSAQVTYTESFDAVQFPSVGWTRTMLAGGNPWSRQTAGTFPTSTPHSGVAMARFNSLSNFYPDSGTANLVTPTISYSQLDTNTAWVSFWVYRDSANLTIGDSLTVLVNTSPTDTGGTRIGVIARSIAINQPDTVPAAGWYQYTFNVPNTFNTSTNYIIFRGTTHHGNRIFIDDVSWVAYPVMCSGTPTAGSISPSTLFICGGSGTSDLTLNGATVFAGVTYQWQSSDSLNGIWTDVGTSDTTLTTATLSANTFFRTVVNCANSGFSDTSVAVEIVVSSTPLPNINVSPNTFTYCAGGAPVPLQASGGAFYTWLPAAGLDVTTGSNVLTSPTGSGGFGGNIVTYTVTGIDSLGCANTANATIQISTPPNVTNVTSSLDTVCAGGTVTLTAQTAGGGGGGGGLTYLWLPEGLSGNNATANPTANTTYTVTVSNNNGCQDTGSVAITVYQASTANFNAVVNGMTVTFTDNSINAASYFWDFGDGNLSLQHNPTYTFSAPGTYTVILTASSSTGCNGDTQALTITIYSLGIESLNSNASVSVAPNPTQDMINIQFIATESKAEVTLMNAIGQVMSTEIISSNGIGRFNKSMQLGSLPKGVYTLRIISGLDSIIQKIVKQ